MQTVRDPAEQRIVLRNVAWETYEHLLADHADSSSPRFAYDRGVLEIMVVSAEHEKPNRLIAYLVEVISEELDLDIENLGSTTFKRRDLQRGFEPDSCFYVQNEQSVRGKAGIDPSVDPPPDLVIEVDITSPSLGRFPIHARFGVPEIWRYDGRKVSIFELTDGEYAEAGRSAALPLLTSDALTRFVEEGLMLGRRAWTRGVREWVRSHRDEEDNPPG